MFWQTTSRRLDLSRPIVMGIVNVTPDSFSDGGEFFRPGAPEDALAHCERLVREGAGMLDIGGESSRPGAQPVPLEEELDRVLPVLRGALKLGLPVSVDTYKPEVMRAALDLGADVINDIWALRRPGAEACVSAYPDCGVCLMHMHREPRTMQAMPMADEGIDALLRRVRGFLAERIDALVARGIARERIVLDPGIGFGKSVTQNLGLLARQADLLALGRPLLSGWSRKSSLGQITGLPAGERLAPSLAAALLALERGARILRVHDVRETVAVVQVWQALANTGNPEP
jgi:dihydropteroate synthase